MAKISSIQKNDRRRKLALKYAERRAALKKLISNPDTPPEERENASEALQKLPRNSSRIRFRNRCALTGRSRANYRKFGLSRIKFRELALKGEIPGVRKSSW